MKHYTLGSVIRAGAWGILLGGAAGFAFGILLAPEKGEKLRRRLAYQLEHIAHQVSGLVDQMVSQGGENEARRKGNALVADATEQAQRIRDDIDALLGEMRRQGTSRQTPSSPE